MSYPRFGPFGARIGNAIPTNPQNAVITITGINPIFSDFYLSSPEKKK